jgi:hypothetical protein
MLGGSKRVRGRIDPDGRQVAPCSAAQPSSLRQHGEELGRAFRCLRIDRGVVAPLDTRV